jgi:hypothetical protein
MTLARTRLRGLLTLVTDVVHHGSRAVEKVHRETAARPFGILEALPDVIAVPARSVHLVHDVSLTATYGSIRIVNEAVRATADVAFDLVDAMAPPSPDANAAEGAPPTPEAAPETGEPPRDVGSQR